MQTSEFITATDRRFVGRIRSSSLWRHGLTWLLLRFEIRRQRRALAALTPWELADIGLTPEQVRRECAKGFRWI